MALWHAPDHRLRVREGGCKGGKGGGLNSEGSTLSQECVLRGSHVNFRIVHVRA